MKTTRSTTTTISKNLSSSTRKIFPPTPPTNLTLPPSPPLQLEPLHSHELHLVILNLRYDQTPRLVTGFPPRCDLHGQHLLLRTLEGLKLRIVLLSLPPASLLLPRPTVNQAPGIYDLVGRCRILGFRGVLVPLSRGIQDDHKRWRRRGLDSRPWEDIRMWSMTINFTLKEEDCEAFSI